MYRKRGKKFNFTIKTDKRCNFNRKEDKFDKTLQDRYTETLLFKDHNYENMFLKFNFKVTFFSHKHSFIQVAFIKELFEFGARDNRLLGYIGAMSENQKFPQAYKHGVRFCKSIQTMANFLKEYDQSDFPDLCFRMDTTLSKIIELSTNSLSKETASSSPSMILHQLVSMVICSSSENDCQFEDTTYRNQPDISMRLKDGSFLLIDVTADQIKDKIVKYDSSRIFVVMKYCFIESFLAFLTDIMHIPKSSKSVRWINKLAEMSKFNDKNDWSFIQNSINRQKVKVSDPQLYSPQIMEYFTTTNQFVIERDSKIASEAFVRYVESLNVSDQLADWKWSIENDYGSFAWMSFPLSARSSYKGWSEGEKEPGFEIVNDQLRINTEVDNLENADRPEEYFQIERNNAYLIDYRTYESLVRYSRASDSIPPETFDYYNITLRKHASRRNLNYFRDKLPGKMKLSDPSSKSSDFIPKGQKVLTNFMKCQPVKPLVFDDPTNLSEINLTLYTAQCLPIDPVDSCILSEAGAPKEYLNLICKSKIYHVLNLFRKASEALSYRSKNDTSFEISSNYTNMKLNIYVSGSVMQVDKGIAYVSLLVDNLLVRTWAWRSADIKDYKLASSRLISTTLPAWKKISCPIRRLYSFSMYSILLLENSWGMSKILKPYRYLVTGISYGSPMIGKQYKKLEEAVRENRQMAVSKMSFSYMCAVFKENMSNTGSPMFGLDVDSMGYEAFMMNLCCSSTYGKRRHQVKMLEEIVTEIKLSECNHSKVLDAQEQFIKLIQISDDLNTVENREQSIKLYLQYFKAHAVRSKEMDGRFTFTPMSILLIYPEIKKMCKTIGFQGTVPPLKELMTMKSSFDPISFKNASAVESISKLCQYEGLTTTSSVAISLLDRMIDLTFRMFDKDQLGGDREISIMSAEYRILQSITESFAKKLGYETGIDMLDNQQKVLLLSEAQNLANRYGGVRDTIDQTRWGPNFNTITFAYMFAVFSRFTTETFIPIYTCILSEHKIFQMLPHPELIDYQITGSTLPGLKAAYHMGQGIFHYTSSLYHSLVHGYLIGIKSKMINDPEMNDSVICSKCFVTSDDVALISYIYNKPDMKRATDEACGRILSKLVNFSMKYSTIIQQFGIKTSDYKNMISQESFEFNSIFLNKMSVGSNSLKFLYSLIDPFTSGDQKRDMRKIFDVFVDSLNSGLTVEEANLMIKINFKSRLLQWGASSETILTIIEMYDSLRSSSEYPITCQDYALPIVCTSQLVTKDPDNDIKCKNVLPYNKYKEHQNSMIKYQQMLDIEELAMETEVKRMTLSRAKKRRLGSNRGLVLNRSIRKQSKIILPVFNQVSATTISGPAYLAMIMRCEGESMMMNSNDGFVMKPSLIQKDAEAGFHVLKYKSSDACSVSATDLLFSSYERVSTINFESSDLERLLHIGRNHKRLRILNQDEYAEWNFAQRLFYFDEIVSNARASGNSSQLVYNETPVTYSAFHFPVLQENIAYLPNRVLLKTSELIGCKSCSVRNVYHLDYYGKKFACNPSTEPRYLLKYIFEDNYELGMEHLLESAKELLITDSSYKSTSARNKECYLNFQIIITAKKPDNEIESYEPFALSAKFGNEELALSDDMIEYFKELLADEGLDFEDQDELKTDVANTDDLSSLFSTSSCKISIKYLSIKCPRYLTCLGQPWFKKHSILNGNLNSLIKQGFIQNSCNTQPESMLYSVLENVRPVRNNSDLPRSKRSKLNLKSPIIRLSALFHIGQVLNECARSTYISTVTTSSKSRCARILSLCRSPQYLTMDLIEGLPGGVTTSDKALGDILSEDQIVDVLGLQNIVIH